MQWLGEKKNEIKKLKDLIAKKARCKTMTEDEKNVQRAHNCALSHNVRSIEQAEFVNIYQLISIAIHTMINIQYL